MSNIRIGKVESVKNTKTVIVSVMHEFRHPLYKKAVKRHRRFAVHNESKTLAVGDTVTIVETRPISKSKHYKIV
jgi:small subunit ribosomal protein S17